MVYRGFFAVYVPILMVVMLPSAAFSQQTRYGYPPYSSAPSSCALPTTETVTLHGNRLTQYSVTDICNVPQSDESRAALSVVKEYWKKNYKDRYRLFSSGEKKTLKRAYNIEDADGYAKHFDPERDYYQQVYERVEHGDNWVTVTVLAFWIQDGYTGVESYFFHLLREGGVWKIGSIMN